MTASVCTYNYPNYPKALCLLCTTPHNKTNQKNSVPKPVLLKTQTKALIRFAHKSKHTVHTTFAKKHI